MNEHLELSATGLSKESLEKWTDNLNAYEQRLGIYFSRSEAKNSAFDYIQTLLCPIQRKNGWQMAEEAGHLTPYRFQHLLSRAVWDEEAFAQEVKSYCVEHLNDDSAIFAVDETCFPKKGNQSVGVQRQYCGLTGQIENCQVGVFLAYISSKGHSIIDRRLYLPRSWSSVSSRRKKAQVPRRVKFASKIQLTKQMLQSAFKAGIRPAWFVADEVYSSNASFWRWLEQNAQQPYLLTVSKQQSTITNFKTCRADKLLGQIQPQDWQRYSCAPGTKGERESDWSRIELSFTHPEGFQRWFLFRRDLKHPEKISYYQVFAAKETSLQTMAEVAGQRWRIEECFEFAKDNLGLGDYEVRSWVGWHRHISLVMAAHVFLSVLRNHIEPLPNLSLPALFLRRNPRNSLAAFKLARGLSSG